MTIHINETERKVLLEGLNSIGWDALPAGHPERKAAERLMKELKVAQAPENVAVRAGEGRG